MPGAHRDTDKRFCDAKTIVTGQSTVYVNGLLWAVEGDLDDHCNQGALQAVYGSKSIYIEGKNIICAVGDIAAPDKEDCFIVHPTGATNPKGKSPNVSVYGGAAGAGT